MSGERQTFGGHQTVGWRREDQHPSLSRCLSADGTEGRLSSRRGRRFGVLGGAVYVLHKVRGIGKLRIMKAGLGKVATREEVAIAAAVCGLLLSLLFFRNWPSQLFGWLHPIYILVICGLVKVVVNRKWRR
jgi:hypothetical protein